jgi:hypothetical protein
MAEDWRVTATLHEDGLVERLLDRIRRHEVEDAVVARLGRRVVVTTGPSQVFVYSDSAEAACEAERLLHEVCAAHGIAAEVAVHRWHPLEEEWEDADAPLPQTEVERDAERERFEQRESEQSQRTGLAEWEVRVELDSHDDAAELADRLAAEGLQPVRRWTYVVVGATNEAEARELARRLEDEAPSDSTITVEAGPAMAREGTAGTRFAAWFD